MTKELRLEICQENYGRILLAEPYEGGMIRLHIDGDSSVLLDKQHAQLLAHTILHMTGEDTHVDLGVPATYNEDAMFDQIYGGEPV